MTNKQLYTLWALLYALCAILGFVPNPGRALGILLTLLAVACFLPPLVLISRRQPHTLRLIRNLSVIYLVLTVVLLVANFLSFTASRLLGNLLYSLLVIVSSPMICGQIWAIGLFGWACLLYASIRALKQT